MQPRILQNVPPKVVRQVNHETRSGFAKESMVKGLTDLPPEILELIYHNLDGIDDVHSFGRAHSRIFHVIKRRTVYTEIMRSVIGHSQHHRYDLHLCNIIVLHRDVVQHFQQGGSPFPVSSNHSGEGYNKWEMALVATTVVPTCASGPCTTCMPDVVVYDILARYQGLRVLEGIWLRRQLEELDLLSADVTQEEEEFLHRYSCLLGRAQDFEQGDLGARSIKYPATQDYTRFNPDQRGRFYSAVVFVWILNELRWILTNFAYPSRSHHHIELLERCRADLVSLSCNPVLDELDRHAIFTFLYHHLLPLHSPVLQDQDSSKLPLTFHTRWKKKDAQPSRFFQLFLIAGQTYFQPPDLIELAVRHKVSRSAPYPQMIPPMTTEQWIRPSGTFAFPANIAFDDVHYRSRFTRLLDTHVSLINRSFRRSAPDSLGIPDYAQRYFIDSVVAAIEKGDNYKENMKPARDIFAGKWQRRGLWSVWWWANSEDKARAIISRWREIPNMPQDQKCNRSPATLVGHEFTLSLGAARSLNSQWQ